MPNVGEDISSLTLIPKYKQPPSLTVEKTILIIGNLTDFIFYRDEIKSMINNLGSENAVFFAIPSRIERLKMVLYEPQRILSVLWNVQRAERAEFVPLVLIYNTNGQVLLKKQIDQLPSLDLFEK